MRPDTALLLAIPTFLLAVTALVGAGVMIAVSRRARTSLRERQAEASRLTVVLGREMPAVRERLARTNRELVRLDQSSIVLTAKMETWTAILAKRRGSLEQTTRGRIHPAARLLRMVSLATRVAILWR